jgi:hypothetical protein
MFFHILDGRTDREIHSLHLGWRNFFAAAFERFLQPTLLDGHVMCPCVSFLVVDKNSFWCYLRT